MNIQTYRFKFFKPLKDDLYKWRKKILLLMLFFSLIIFPAPLSLVICLSLIGQIDNFFDFLLSNWLNLLLLCIVFFSWILFTFWIVKRTKTNLQHYHIIYYIFLGITFNFVILYFVIYVNKQLKKLLIENVNSQGLPTFFDKQVIVAVRDKWFYFKIFSAIFAWSAIIFSYLYHLLNRIYIRDIDYEFSILLYNDQFISFFTHQSNILIASWFTLAVILHHRKQNHWLFKTKTVINVTTYISVTSLTFLLIIYPGSIKHLSLIGHLIGLSLHLVVPFLMVFYTFNHIGKEYINYKKYWSNFKQGISVMMIYPILYCTYVVIRLVIYSILDYDLNVGFPYLPKHFFPPNFNELIRKPNFPFIGVVLWWSFTFTTITLFIFVNLILFININILYIVINNIKYNKKIKVEKNYHKIIKHHLAINK